MLFSDNNKWFSEASCVGSTDLFFPDIKRGGSASREYKLAIEICKDCKVIKECLSYSLSENLVEFGVFGGLPPKARRKMLRRTREKQNS